MAHCAAAGADGDGGDGGDSVGWMLAGWLVDWECWDERMWGVWDWLTDWLTGLTTKTK